MGSLVSIFKNNLEAKLLSFIKDPNSHNYDIQTFLTDFNKLPDSSKEQISKGVAQNFASLKKLLLSWNYITISKYKNKLTKKEEYTEMSVKPKKNLAKANRFSTGISLLKDDHEELYEYDQKEILTEEFKNHLVFRDDRFLSSDRNPFLLYFNSPGNGKTAKLDQLADMALNNELHNKINQPNLLYPQLENCLAINVNYNDKMDCHTLINNRLFETDLVARNVYSYFYDLDGSGSICFSKFIETFSFILKHISYEKVISFLIQDWKEHKQTEHEVMLISCIDELRILEDVNTKDNSNIKSILEIIKPIQDKNRLYVFTALDPSVFNISGMRVSTSGSGRGLHWKLTKRMSKENMKKLISKCPTPSTQKESDILFAALQLTDGHYRSVQSIVMEYNDIHKKGESLLTAGVIEKLIYCPPLTGVLNPQIENNWIFLAEAILQHRLKLDEELLIGKDVLSHIILGTYLNEIGPDDYFEKKNSIVPQVSFMFLYSFARYALGTKSNVDERTLVLAKLMKELVENCIKIDNSKAFEIFNCHYILLILQMRSFLCAPSDLMSITQFAKEYTKKTTLTVRELFFDKITFDKKDVLDLEIKLIDENNKPFIYKFDQDQDRPYEKETNKQPGRSLVDRFSNQKFNFNTFYLSSLTNEPGIEGHILLPLSNGDSLLISLQTKLQYENTRGAVKIAETEVGKIKDSNEKFANFLLSNSHQGHVGSNIHKLPLLISNKILSPSVNKDGLGLILHEKLGEYLGFSFKFPFANSFISK